MSCSAWQHTVASSTIVAMPASPKRCVSAATSEVVSTSTPKWFSFSAASFSISTSFSGGSATSKFA